MWRLYFLFVIIFCFHMFIAGASYAAVTVVQALDFGEFVVKNNDAQYDITVNTNGSYSYDAAGFIEITAPQEGIYDLDGMAPSTAIVSVVITQLVALSGSGPDFQMINLQESSPASTDGAGVARIVVGGTAQTSGSGTLYTDQTFNGQLQIQINF